MNLKLNPETDLSFTRTLAAPRHLIWECWTQPKHIPHFFVPAPNRVTSVEIDLRAGGRFNTTFDVDGTIMENNGVYLEVVPEERLVFTDAYAEGWVPAPEPWVVPGAATPLMKSVI
jgi:uncharacterized protein YndB with AHSA1/START domain